MAPTDQTQRAAKSAWRQQLVTSFALFGLIGCTSYASLVHEFDGLVGFDREQVREAGDFEVRDTTWRYPSFLTPLEPLSPVLGFERSLTEVAQPRRALRTSMQGMVSRTGNKLDRLTDVAWRLLLIVEADAADLDRASAVRALVEIYRKLPARPAVAGDRGLELPGTESVTDRAAFEQGARAIVESLTGLWPSDPPAKRGVDDARRYVALVQRLGDLEAASLDLERARLRLLHEALVWEADGAVQREVAKVLLGCLRGAVCRGFRGALLDASPLVRTAGLDAVFRIERERLLPLATALLAAGAAARVANTSSDVGLIDESVDVRRRLIRLTWALPLADTRARVADAPSPLEFLVETSTRDPEHALRLVARDALSTLAGRRYDPTGSWIAAWWKRVVTTGQDGE